MNLSVAFWIATGILGIISLHKLRGLLDKYDNNSDAAILTFIFSALITLGFLTTAIATTATFYAGQATCIDNGKTMQVKTEYKGLLQGCFMKYKGYWQPWNRTLILFDRNQLPPNWVYNN